MSIAEDVLNCDGAFRELQALATDDLHKTEGEQKLTALYVTKINSNFERFQLWASNLGANRHDHNSLDRRLWEASHLRDRVKGYLKDLDEGISDTISIIAGERTPWDQLSDSQSEGSDCENDGETTELDQLSAYISNTIGCLFRVSMILQKPAPHDRFIKSGKFDQSFRQTWDEQYVRDKFVNVPEWLGARLGKAISRRRQFLEYWKNSHQRLTASDDRNIEEGAAESTVVSSLPTVAQQDEVPPIENDMLILDEGSVTSYAESIFSQDTLYTPKLPEAAIDGASFECPYCFMVVSQIHNKLQWKRHVFADLQPYVCLYPDCISADKTFARRRDWIEHEKRLHSTTWRCNLGCIASFSSRTDMRKHFTNVHNLSVQSDDQLYALSLEIEQGPLDTAACPLCNDKITSNSKYHKHLARHQEQIALCALPRESLEEENEVNEPVASESRDEGLATRLSEYGETNSESSSLPDDNDYGSQEALEASSLNNALNNAYDKPGSASRVDPDLIARITAEVKRSVLDEIKMNGFGVNGMRSSVLASQTNLPQEDYSYPQHYYPATSMSPGVRPQQAQTLPEIENLDINDLIVTSQEIQKLRKRLLQHNVNAPDEQLRGWIVAQKRAKMQQQQAHDLQIKQEKRSQHRAMDLSDHAPPQATPPQTGHSFLSPSEDLTESDAEVLNVTAAITGGYQTQNAERQRKEKMQAKKGIEDRPTETPERTKSEAAAVAAKIKAAGINWWDSKSGPNMSKKEGILQNIKEHKGQESMRKQSGEAASKTSQICEDCGLQTPRAWICWDCNISLCDNCWDKQLPHRPGQKSRNGLPHVRNAFGNSQYFIEFKKLQATRLGWGKKTQVLGERFPIPNRRRLSINKPGTEEANGTQGSDRPFKSNSLVFSDLGSAPEKSEKLDTPLARKASPSNARDVGTNVTIRSRAEPSLSVEIPDAGDGGDTVGLSATTKAEATPTNNPRDTSIRFGDQKK